MKRIDLHFFRCFDRLTLEFKPGVNLLVGDNASGKTSLLAACKYVLSTFFSGFSTQDTKWLSPKDNDFMSIVNDGYMSEGKPLSIEFELDPRQLPELSFNERLRNFDLLNKQVIRKNSTKNSRPIVSGLCDIRYYSESLKYCYVVYDYQTKAEYHIKPLPLFVSYTTEDIHTSRKIEAKKFITYAKKRSFGYYECLAADGLLKYWLKRLLVLQEAGEQYYSEISLVRSALINALGPMGCDIIYDMSIRPNVKKVFYVLKDGREIEADLLSDGYKRLVSIVTDMAARCAILNRPYFGDQAVIQTRGTAIIDEIDLHLHPSLQANIITGLKNAFPGVQFIISTHSPMVMSGVRPDNTNVVYKMSYNPTSNGYNVSEVNPYGMDISSISKYILNLTDRNADVQHRIDELYNAINEDKYNEAEVLLNKLTGDLGYNIRELIEARTIINLETAGNETDC